MSATVNTPYFSKTIRSAAALRKPTVAEARSAYVAARLIPAASKAPETTSSRRRATG